MPHHLPAVSRTRQPWAVAGRYGLPMNPGAYDGYQAERAEVSGVMSGPACCHMRATQHAYFALQGHTGLRM